MIGASHVRSGTENQDAIGWAPPGGSDRRVVLAVSDGHGSPTCFRSAQGSELAVRTARRQGIALVEGTVDGPAGLSLVKRALLEETPRQLVREWRRAVADDVAEQPFTEDELSRLADRAGADARARVESDPALAYGATVLLVLATEAYVAFLQLGDGAIVEVNAGHEAPTANRALPDDELAFANETTSLCSPDASQYLRVRFDPIFGAAPMLMLASSDGFVNSFADEDGFLRFGPELLGQLEREGVEAVEDRLEDWLQQMTNAGSGDDITLGLILGVDR